MKHLKSFIIIAVIAGGTLLARAQTTGGLMDAYGSFAFQLMEKAEQHKKDPKDNVVLSPVSAWLALSMLQNGAANNTLAQMQQAMNSSGFSVDDINLFNQKLVKQLSHIEVPEWASSGSESDKELIPVLETANSIWSDTGYPFYDSFYNVNQKYYEAELRTLDLSLPASIKEVDKWVDGKTHGTIKSVNVDPDDYLRMLLVNALYFKGSWEKPFEKESTQTGQFYNNGSDVINVPMMHLLETLPYAHIDGYDVVRLYYCYDQRFSMTLFVPDGSVEQKSLGFSQWQAASKALKNNSIKLSMPRFTTDGEMELTDVLKDMGMNDAFISGVADFSLMSSGQLFVDFVKQLSHIAVDEKGTVASAVTVIGVKDTAVPGQPKSISVDHPFYFTIEDNQTGAVLFIGHVLKVDGEYTNGLEKVNAEQSKAKVYDLQGRRLKSVPQKGLYIYDRKVMGR